MNRLEKRIVIKTISKNLSDIHKTAKSISKAWGVKTIPLTALSTIIDTAKPSLNTGSKENDLINMQWGNLLEQLKKDCNKIAKKMDSKSIPLITLKAGLDIIKNSFIEGLNRN